MNNVRILIRDASSDITTTENREFAELVASALSAEPQTIAEFERALGRFLDPDEWPGFAGFAAGLNDQPGPEGVLVADLAARLLVLDLPDSELPAGDHAEDEFSEQDRPFRYRLPEDWLVLPRADGWQQIADQRRRDHAAQPPLDARAVLYGRPLLEQLAGDCFAALHDLPAPDEEEDEYNSPAAERVRDVHARWLTTPRSDLRGLAPRDVLLEKRDYLGWDLQDRANEWSSYGKCPAGLDVESHAYQFAGFGTHEIVMYYELVRELLWSCRERVATLCDVNGLPVTRGDFLTCEIPRLEQVREKWLDAPDPEYHGRTPRSIMERERARLPEGVSGHEAMVDDDCPLCQMMADLPGPMFWHIDGCNMDEDFAFSFHRTREEYEQERREWDEFHRQWEEREAERKRLGVEYPETSASDSVWRRSLAAGNGPDVPVGVRLFGIGSHLAELIVELKSPTEDRPSIDALGRHFGNLRDVVAMPDAASAASLIEPVLDRFCETLEEIGSAHLGLAERCDDLARQVRGFLQAPPTGNESGPYLGTDNDVPF